VTGRLDDRYSLSQAVASSYPHAEFQLVVELGCGTEDGLGFVGGLVLA
jgi:hypothetical protein